MSETPKLPEEQALPPPDAALTLWRVSIESFLVISGRKKGEKFLRLIAEQLAAEENLAQVFHIRPARDTLAVRKARREAAELFRRWLPVFLARLPRD